MGIFSKLAQSITGGGVKVSLECSETVLGKPIQVHVSAAVASNDKDVSGVYVRVQAVENVTVHNVRVAENAGGHIEERVRDVSESHTLFDQRYTIAGAQQLKAEQTYDWSGSIVIPAEQPPTYKGANAALTWRIVAGLETKGNDPDSHWAEIPVTR